MTNQDISARPITVTAQNIGGIADAEVTFEPGVTILAGRNATNRTSLLRAIMLALGSEKHSLKGDADTGKAELSIDGNKFTRTLTREEGNIKLGGEPFLGEPEVADLFAFLLEENEARRAVARGENLKELIMRPIDTDAIRSRIKKLENDQRTLEKDINSLEEAENRLPELKTKRQDLEEKIEVKKEELVTAREELDSADASLEESRKEHNELESKIQEIRETRSDLNRLRHQIETEEASIESVKEEREEVQAELEKLPTQEDPSVEISGLESDIEKLRERKRTLSTTVDELQNIVQFNEEMLEDNPREIRSALEMDNNNEVTNQLVDNQTVCWTCGQEVESEKIGTTIDQLKEFRRKKANRINDTEDQIEELRDELQSIKSQRERQENLQNKQVQIADEIESRQERLEDLHEQLDSISTELETLEEEADKLEGEEFDEILALNKDVNDLEFTVERLENEKQTVQSEIKELKEEIDRKEDLKTEREKVRSDLLDARSRIDEIQEQAIDEFNSQIESVLEILEYTNLERIWIERKETRVREGRRKVEKTEFDLHIIRTNESGTTYEDSIDHLSESEREVVGLVFGLAGYLVHEVYETLPFIILDSLEALDSDRIAKLVDYFSEYADYSLVALLPEDDQALDDGYQRVRDI